MISTNERTVTRPMRVLPSGRDHHGVIRSNQQARPDLHLEQQQSLLSLLVMSSPSLLIYRSPADHHLHAGKVMTCQFSHLNILDQRALFVTRCDVILWIHYGFSYNLFFYNLRRHDILIVNDSHVNHVENQRESSTSISTFTVAMWVERYQASQALPPQRAGQLF